MVARAKGRERVKKRGRESVEYARKKERVELKESSQKEKEERRVTLLIGWFVLQRSMQMKQGNSK